MPDKIITRAETGEGSHHLGYRHTVWLGEGNAAGYVKVCLWPYKDRHNDDPGGRRAADALTERLAALIADDDECQRILREDYTARTEKKK